MIISNLPHAVLRLRTSFLALLPVFDSSQGARGAAVFSSELIQLNVKLVLGAMRRFLILTKHHFLER